MKAILFDFGGTIDTGGVHWSEKFWEVYERFNIPVPKQDFEMAFVHADEELMKEGISRATFHDILFKQISKQFLILKLNGDHGLLRTVTDACYRDVWNVVNNAKKIFQELLPFYTLGVVSNFYGNLDVVCREFGLEKFFRAMIDSAVVGIRKPDPGIFSLALKQLGVSPHESFVLGDSYERDVVPSKQLGCSTIWLCGKSWNVPSNTEAADYTIRRFEEVKMIVLG